MCVCVLLVTGPGGAACFITLAQPECLSACAILGRQDGTMHNLVQAQTHRVRNTFACREEKVYEPPYRFRPGTNRLSSSLLYARSHAGAGSLGSWQSETLLPPQQQQRPHMGAVPLGHPTNASVGLCRERGGQRRHQIKNSVRGRRVRRDPAGRQSSYQYAEQSASRPLHAGAGAHVREGGRTQRRVPAGCLLHCAGPGLSPSQVSLRCSYH